MNAPAVDRLTAVVVNWRTPDLTLRATESLLADGIAAERLVVVDNGSADGSAERLRRALPGSRVIALPENRGFAHANNLAAASLPATGAYLLVNSDAAVHVPGSVTRLLDAFRDPAVGVAVPRLVNPDGTLQRSVYPLPRPAPELVRAAGLSRLVPERWAPQLGAHWSHARSRPISYAIGAVVAVRGVVWRQLGGLAERRGMYAEDLDLFWRVAQRGWSARFVADSCFVHLGGASSAHRWSEVARAERVAAAEAATIRTHAGPAMAASTVALMVAGAGRRRAICRLRGDAGGAAVQAAWMRGYLSRGRAARG